MVRKIFISGVCAVALTNMMYADEDLGVIQVESSTIEDLTTDLKTESSTVNIIDEKTIEEIDPKNINDLLQTIPGVTADVRSDIVEIHIRGVNQQEFMGEDTGVVVVIDGVPVMQDGGKVRGINIDEIESIKVIKGSASYLYGEQAGAGAIIITTKKPKDRNGGSVSLEYGSEDYKNIKLKGYRSTDKYAINVMAGYKDEDGYWYQTANDQKTFSAKFTYYIDDTSDISASVDVTDRYQETTRGGVTGVTAAEENPTGEDGDWAWSKDYNSDIYKYLITYNKDFADGGNLMVNAYYYKDLYDYMASPQDLDGDKNDDTYVRDSNDDIKQYGLKAEYRNTMGNLAYMLGAEAGRREFDEYDETVVDYSAYNYRTHSRENYYAGEYSDEESKEDIFAIYGEAKYKVTPKLTTIFNLRYDHNKYDTTTFEHDYDGSSWSDTVTTDEKDYDNVTYRVGTTYEFSKDNIFYANVSTGFRNPSVSQDDDNPDIDTETYITYEAGFRGKTPFGARYEVSAFMIDTKDIISRVDGTYNWDSDYYDNVGDSRSLGLEVSLKGNITEKLSYSLAYTYLNSYYTSHKPFTVHLSEHDETYDITGNKLPRVPHNKIDLMLGYQLTSKLKLWGEFYAQSSYYADETNFVEMPGYGKLNLKLTYKPTKNLELFAKVDNVFDKQYYRTVYLFRDSNGDDKFDAEDATITVDPGRVFTVGLKYKF